MLLSAISTPPPNIILTPLHNFAITEHNLNVTKHTFDDAAEHDFDVTAKHYFNAAAEHNFDDAEYSFDDGRCRRV